MPGPAKKKWPVTSAIRKNHGSEVVTESVYLEWFTADTVLKRYCGVVRQLEDGWKAVEASGRLWRGNFPFSLGKKQQSQPLCQNPVVLETLLCEVKVIPPLSPVAPLAGQQLSSQESQKPFFVSTQASKSPANNPGQHLDTLQGEGQGQVTMSAAFLLITISSAIQLPSFPEQLLHWRPLWH
jgi:hypothetical protein